MGDVETSEKFVIDGIDYWLLVKKLEKEACFTHCRNWEDFLNSILSALLNMKNEIIQTSQRTDAKRRSIKYGSKILNLSGDYPTDIYWVLSILFGIRTIGMLYSKSIACARDHYNQKAHQKLLERYKLIFQELFERREELLTLFPPN